MGFARGTGSYTPYLVRGADSKTGRDAVIEGLARGRISPIDVALGHDRSTGFSVFDNPLDLEFSVDKVFFDPLVLFCLRIDKLSVPPSTLRLHIRSRVNEVLAARGSRGLPRSQRDDISEQVRGELLRRALPAIGAYEVVWDTSIDRIRLYSSSPAVNEEFALLVREYLELDIQPMNTVGVLEHGLEGEEMDTVYHMMPTTFVAANPAAAGPREDD